MLEGQMTLWDLMEDKPQPYLIDKPIRLIELFAGVGSQAMALRDIGADFEHYRVVEFDKYAIASYNAIHGTDFPTMDVTKLTGEDLGIVDSERFTYLLTYSFPCTDLSVAGKMAGMEEGSGTRSSLLWEVRRLLEETKELPQILMMENVPQVHSKSNMPSFLKWLDFLESKGYKNYWQDMNAKNYGVAQSRNRTIMISLLGNYSYTFPDPFPLDKCMKDYLEPDVEEKYYLNNDKARDLIEKLIIGGKLIPGKSGVDLCSNNAEIVQNANTIKARYDSGIVNHAHDNSGVIECTEIQKVGNMANSNQRYAVYDGNGVSPTIQAAAGTGGGQVPMSIDIQVIGQMDNTQDHTFESANRVYKPEGIAPTIPTCGGGGIQPKIMEIKELGHIEKGTGKHQSNVIYDNNGLCPTICAGLGVKQQPTMSVEVKALDEQNNSIHDDGTVGTLTTDGSSPKHNNRVMEIQKVGNVVGKGESQGGNTYLTEGISPSLLAGMSHGNVMPFIVDEKPLNTMEDGTCRTIKSQYHFTTTQNLDTQGTFGATGAVSIVAMRGRDTTNPNHRGPANENYEQRLEERTDGCTNTITTVQKDNLVLIKQATKDGYIPCELGGVADLNYPNSQTRRGRVINQGNVSPTLTTENIPSVLEKWIWEIDGVKYLIRIRKLTPKECWRLMGFSDEDFEKAEKVNSNTQLYKQAGNSIVKDVLMNVFLQLVKGDK